MWAQWRRGLQQFTTDVLFRDLWLRPGLAPGIGVSSPSVRSSPSGMSHEIPYRLNRAMDRGLTKAEASEVLTHLAFYAGWPNDFWAVPVLQGRIREACELRSLVP